MKIERRGVVRGPFTATQRGLDGAPDVTVVLDVTLDRHGHSRCSRIEISREDGEPVSDRTLGRISVDSLTRQAMGEADSWFRLDKRAGTVATYVMLDAEERTAAYRRHAEGARKPRRGSPIPDGFLEQVAEVYREAVKNEDPAPARVVAETFGGALSTAKRWVRMARERKFLGPAQRGIASA